MGLPALGKMSAAEYAKLAEDPRALMRYNSPLPETDYEHPYTFQEYPKHLYRVERVGKKQRLRTAEIKNKEEEDGLRGQGWVPNPMLCDPPVETAPGAPAIRISVVYEVELPDVADEAAPAVAEATAAAPRRRGPNKPKHAAAGA